MERFYLQRNVDVTGVSGEGRVMEGVVLFDGRVVSTWLSKFPSVTVHTNIQAAEHIHSHGGNSIFIFLPEADEEYPKLFLMSHLKKRELTRVGVVAEVAEFSNGRTVLNWLITPFQIEAFDSMRDLCAVHEDNDYTIVSPYLPHPEAQILSKGD